jgi:hypothetical protein
MEKDRVCLADWFGCCVVDTARCGDVWDKYVVRAFGDREGRGDMNNTPFVVSLWAMFT